MRILLVEDTEELADSIRERLSAEGHAVDVERDGASADGLLAHAVFDLVILDVHLPSLSGFDVLSRMRARGNATPVLILTARSQIDDRVTGLDVGADDYMVKPVDFRELAARCRAIVRRRSGVASNRFQAGGFVFDRSARRASVDEKDLELRPREVQALELFLANLDRVMTKEEVADRIYTFDEAPSLNAVEQTLTRLRRKLTDTPLRIRTIRGLGYIASVADG